MSSSEFLKRAKRLIREYPEMFNALEEYDHTRKLTKVNYKTRANFTIDADVLRQFRSHCQKFGLNMSRLIENYFKEELKNKAS